MISEQIPIHSSQIYVPFGPAISFLTCACVLLQKEHLTISSVGFPAIFFHLKAKLMFCDHLVDQTVRLCLIGRHKIVTLCICLDRLKWLSCICSQYFIQFLFRTQNVFCRDLDLCRLSLRSAWRLIVFVLTPGSIPSLPERALMILFGASTAILIIWIPFSLYGSPILPITYSP